MSKRRVLTGITTTGTPHLGNYVGAIRPAVAASKSPDVDAYLFLADYHALIKCQDPETVAESSRQIAASWLASGLDPDKAHFYRQSDIPEITELCWILTCNAAKGLMNRAHAYKAAVQQNEESGEDPDYAVTMAHFCCHDLCGTPTSRHHRPLSPLISTNDFGQPPARRLPRLRRHSVCRCLHHRSTRAAQADPLASIARDLHVIDFGILYVMDVLWRGRVRSPQRS